MKDKILTLLGFAQKAGKLVSGTEQVLKSIEAHKTYLCFVGNNVAEGTMKKVVAKCTHYNVPLNDMFTVEELSAAIGKENRTVIGINDKGFSASVSKLAPSNGAQVQ